LPITFPSLDVEPGTMDALDPVVGLVKVNWGVEAEVPP